jgi:hypothetical protein
MKILAILVGVIFIILSAFFIKDCYSVYRIRKHGIIVDMQIVEIPRVCSGTKAKHFMKVRYKANIYSKQIGPDYCGMYKAGDIIQMKYLDGEDQIIFPKDDSIVDIVSAFLLLSFGIFIIFYALKTL